MTLIVALKSKHGVVIAGDKRASDVNPTLTYNDFAVKIYRLNKRVAIGGAGSNYDCTLIIDEMLKETKIKDMDVEEIKKLLFDKARTKQAEWYQHPGNSYLIKLRVVEPPAFGFLLVGIDNDNKPKIYAFSHSDKEVQPLLRDYFPLGYCDISEYIFRQKYKDTMTIDELSELATYSIIESSKISAGVSKNFDLIKIKTP